MFQCRIFCTSKLIAKVLLAIYNNHYANQKYLLLKKILEQQSISIYIDESCYQEDERDYYKPIVDEFLTQKILESYDEVKVDYYEHSNNILTVDKINIHHSDIFILNKDEDYCDTILNNLGIFTISELSLKNLELLFLKSELRINKGDEYNSTNDIIKFGWHTLLRQHIENNIYKTPNINSLIINDCYLFDLDKKRGVNNCISLIKGILLNSKLSNIQISIFTLTSGSSKTSKSDSFFDSIIDDLDAEFPNTEIEIYAHNSKEDLHARVLVSNYTFIEDPHEKGFDLFEFKSGNNQGKAIRNGSINIKNILSDFDSYYSNNKNSTLIVDINKYLKLFKKCRKKVIENKNMREGLIQNLELKYFSNKKNITGNKNSEFINRLLLDTR